MNKLEKILKRPEELSKGVAMPRREGVKSKRVEELDVDGVATVLERWGMQEFVELVRERQVDGRRLLEVTEGIVKLWRPKVDARKFILFVQELKVNTEKYLEGTVKNNMNEGIDSSIEAQYKTVNVKRKTEQFPAAVSSVEELLKRIVPAKSFLYRNQPTKIDKPVTSYVPMNGTRKKSRRFFRLSSYEYPHFDPNHKRNSKTENFNDRGYYSIKTNSRFYIQKTYRKPETRPKYKSLSAAEELDKVTEDHFYEDLNYSETEKENNDLKEITVDHNVKPYKVKIQELFQSFKLPFFKKNEEIEGEKRLEEPSKPEEEKDAHIYENSDSITSMYDSVHVRQETNADDSGNNCTLPVEEYLEPVQLSKDYCDVSYRHRDESILGYIMSLFESRFGTRRETNDANQSEDSEESKVPCTLDDGSAAARCPDDRKGWRSNMADRPLPVPVENEPYYMNIDRSEAENLLRGQPDGTFVLRPSSQPTHAYTLTVSCSNAVHNVGVRRRPDGRLALGFARRGERSFPSVTSLLRHHRRRRLLLVAGGSVCGATTLNDTPQYYQTPSNLPLPM